MSLPETPFGDAVWDLPPLILHPFSDGISPAALLESSRAALMLSGLIAGDGSEQDELRQRLLAGRYSEIRMLFYLGKDVSRWIGQCLEFISRIPELEDAGIRSQSFASMLASNPPEPAKEKLVSWGVLDYTSIFSRSLGLHSVFTEPPLLRQLGEEFLERYHIFADALFRCYLELEPYRAISPANFRFALYASGEYARLLESEWENPQVP
jgi:hypothetical protein